MSKLQMLAVIVCVLVILPACIHHAQARPGPTAFHSVESTSGELQPPHEAESGAQLQSVELPKVYLNESEELDSNEEVDIVCMEMETCDQKRILTASIDYKNDGPNDPITDPPH